MVAPNDGPAAVGRRSDGVARGRGSGRGRRADAIDRYQPWRKNTRNRIGDDPHQRMDLAALPRATLISTHEMKPAPMPTVMS